MIELLKNSIPALRENWDKYKDSFKEIRVKSKTMLLREGEAAKKMFFIKEGCLRMSFYSRGRDITFQFFFEGQAVSSFESFRTGQPSQFAIETIEPSRLIVVHRKDFERLQEDFPEIKSQMQEIMINRFSRYAMLFLSFIKDTPVQRYMDLLQNEPRIIQRVPLHYIASYLGITPVSLSRIRKKVQESVQRPTSKVGTSSKKSKYLRSKYEDPGRGGIKSRSACAAGTEIPNEAG